MNPPAGYPHGAVESRAVRLLANFVFDRQLGEVFGSSQGFELPSADTVEPDASYVSRARWAAAPAPEAGSFLRVAPDLVVEILSGATAARDRGEKRAIYERNGVGEYWLVDPAARSLTLLVLEGVSYGAGRVLGEHDEVASSVLPGLRFRVAQVLP